MPPKAVGSAAPSVPTRRKYRYRPRARVEAMMDEDDYRGRWYAAEVKRYWCPWAWAKGDDPSRVIAALELLGDLPAAQKARPQWSPSPGPRTQGLETD